MLKLIELRRLLLLSFFCFVFINLGFSTDSKDLKKSRPKLDYSKIRAIGMPAYVSRKKSFYNILTNAHDNNLNTIVFFFKDIDPRGDYYKYVPVTNIYTDNDGQKHQKIIKQRKLIPRHLGNVFFPTTNTLAKKIHAKRSFVKDVKLLQQTMWNHDLELAARICLFGDYKMAEYLRKKKSPKVNHIKILKPSDTRWNSFVHQSLKSSNKFPVVIYNKSRKNRDKIFVDPLNKEVVAYNLSLAKELYDKGIRIFVFDYVRMEDPAGVKNYDPNKYLFSHVAIEKTMKYIKNEMQAYRQKHHWGPDLLLSISVFGRSLFKTYKGTMDPVGQNINTFHDLGYKISSMDYTSLLLPKWRKKPYIGRTLYLTYGIAKVGKEAMMPWIDTIGGSAPQGKRQDYVNKELKAIVDLGITSFIFWIPSGHSREFDRAFKALRSISE